MINKGEINLSLSLSISLSKFNKKERRKREKWKVEGKTCTRDGILLHSNLNGNLKN